MDVSASIVTLVVTGGVSALSVFLGVKYGLESLKSDVKNMDARIEADLKEIKGSMDTLKREHADNAKQLAVHEYRINNLEKNLE